MEIISIGDVVRLNSGGPRMTVVSAPDTSLPTSAVSVVWTLDSGHTERAMFPAACIFKLPKEANDSAGE